MRLRLLVVVIVALMLVPRWVPGQEGSSGGCRRRTRDAPRDAEDDDGRGARADEESDDAATQNRQQQAMAQMRTRRMMLIRTIHPTSAPDTLDSYRRP